MNIFQKLSENFLNLKIVYKFLFVLIVFIIGMAVIAYAFESAFDVGNQTLTNAKKQQEIADFNYKLQTEISSARIYAKNFRLSNDVKDRESFINSLKRAQVQLNQLSAALLDAAEKKRVSNLKASLTEYEKAFVSASETSIDDSFSQFEKLAAFENTIASYQKALVNLVNGYAQKTQTDFEQSTENAHLAFWIVVSIVPLTIILVLWLVLVIGVIKPISYLQSVLNEIAAGNLDARADSGSKDEIGNLSNAFDSLLDERVTSLAKTEFEHQQLNTSIIALLRSVSVLSQKDLTVKVPVAEDMTGAVSDSINLLTDEMSSILKGVADISARVNKISGSVKQQSNNVILFAENQRKEINATLEELNTAVNTMIKIAKFSQVTNKESEKTMLTTESAVEAVTETVASINSIRDIIRETEKRIKRLGERSQEITGVVNIINNIAERTHVLSLNAGMQAASAGEAGKGFMVVANEVQRLAESSREATEKIATLVKNIQVDTSDTMKTMNTVISQVVEGTQQAEEAGKRMKESRATTQSLVASVKKIAATTIAQLEIGKSLKEHAQNIQNTTIKTNQQLQQQQSLSDELARDADDLLVKVNVFKLPE